MRGIILGLTAAALVFSGCGDKADTPTTPAATDKKASTDTKPAPAKVVKKSPVKPAAGSQPMKAPAALGVHFVWPHEGSTVFTEFDTAFGLTGMTLTPAGQAVNDKTKGHHHIIVDAGPIPEGKIVPKDATHIHFGGGQAQAKLTLTPGAHTLTMQLADGAHMSYGPKLAKTIKINVVAKPAQGPRIFFASPADKAKVKSPVKLKFGAEGLTVGPAGLKMADKTYGHHHIVVDGKPIKLGSMVPKDATHIHFGKGQTEAEIPLSKGTHTLTMQFADGAHRSYGKGYSSTITVEVE